MAGLTIALALADLAIIATIAHGLTRRPATTTSLEGGPPKPYSVGDHVNVLPPFDGAMPPVDGGYRVVAVNSYVDGLTGEPGQTCTITSDANLFDFAGQYLEPYTPPEEPPSE